jgi:osmotically-inducible protein OsmY
MSPRKPPEPPPREAGGGDERERNERDRADSGRRETRAERNIARALRRSDRVSRHSIRIREHEETVELRGRVGSYREKLEAQRAVRDVDARSVRNRIEVDESTVRADAEIADDLREALREEDRLPDPTLTVDVRTGKAFLRGTLTEEEAVRLVEEVALAVPGVRETVSLVRIDAREHATDRHAARAIHDRIRRWPKLRGRVHVAVAGNTVELSGEVGSERQRLDAENVAREYPILRVRNEIRVEGERERSRK